MLLTCTHRPTHHTHTVRKEEMKIMTDSPKDDEAAAEMPCALPTSEFHSEMPTRNTHEEKHLTHLVEATHHHERAATHHAHAAEGHLEISERHWRRPRAQYISLSEKVARRAVSCRVGAGVVGMRGWDPCGRPSGPSLFPLSEMYWALGWPGEGVHLQNRLIFAPVKPVFSTGVAW